MNLYWIRRCRVRVKDMLSYKITPKRCCLPSRYSTQSPTELVTEHGISPPAQKRVIELLSQYKDMPNVGLRKGKQRSLNNVTSWVDGGAGYIDLGTFNFLLHICVTCGSADDLDLVLAVARRQGLKMGEPEMNSVLSGLSKNGDFAMVKEILKRMCEDGLKIRLNTLTHLLQRGASERDFHFTIEVLDMMRANNFFPSSVSAINNTIIACVGGESSEAVRVVKGVMALHNSYSMDVHQHDVNQDTATEFSRWIESLSRGYISRSTRINDSCVCESCGEKLLSNELTSEEQDTLLKYFKDELVADIYTGSNVVKEEAFLKKFLKYIDERSGEFGVVIDGLNIAYTCTRKRQMAFQTMVAISKELATTTGKKVLVVGRQHLLKTLSSKRMSPEYIHEQLNSHGVHFIPLVNSTPDDGYILYAALANKSFVLSNDKYGSELSRVNRDDIARIMMKWLVGSVTKLNIERENDRGRKQIKLILPSKVWRGVQWTDNGWHLPLETPLSNNWLCTHIS